MKCPRKTHHEVPEKNPQVQEVLLRQHRAKQHETCGTTHDCNFAVLGLEHPQYGIHHVMHCEPPKMMMMMMTTTTTMMMMMDFLLLQSDVRHAYLQALLRGPPVYIVLPKCVWPQSWSGMYAPALRLRKAIYGLKRSGFDWMDHAT